MHEKKRKRHSDGTAERSPKKTAIASYSGHDTVKVSLLEDVDEWTPVLGALAFHPNSFQVVDEELTPTSLDTRPLAPFQCIFQIIQKTSTTNLPIRRTYRSPPPQR